MTSLSNNSILEDLKTALDFFFRRRPTLASLMWHTENIQAGKTFVIPKGKIYEVFAYAPTGDLMLNGIGIHTTGGGYVTAWFPMSFALENEYPIGFDPSADGALTRYDADNFTSWMVYSMSSQGWILSENDILSNSVNEAWKVRWRDVTHRQ